MSIAAADDRPFAEQVYPNFLGLESGSPDSAPAVLLPIPLLDSLGPQVYLTVDVDGFDPSVIPSTGTPEPGGLSWWDGVELIRAVGQQRHIVGADITELAVTGDRAADRIGAFAAAKLAYQILTAALESQS
ncbi:arginase family protein [Synechococcus sp. PCC 7336]|uniref:arginase family protein n=1 Tax=Synechococcus sp. PCC 7336 TaxID=195250 RepID=UPI00034840D6|nr:arginase family protein [Synechococcus sp. PCC 7336]